MGKKKEKKNDTHDINVLLAEYSQAWSHYRHLENTRIRYMNFFFTALFAIIGLYSTLLNLKKVEIGELQVILGMILLQIFILFTLFILINVTRIGRVLKGYQGVKGNLRQLLFSQSSVPNGVSVGEHIKGPKSSKLFSVQKSSRFMLLLTIIFANAFSILLLFTSYYDIALPYRILLLSLFAIVILLQIFVIIIKLKDR
ncbi:hypothetical protein [Croceivirga thetidis]|uniref:DUF3278 domain-containing protein n=1 Tax=Croceivirga thetidis TaxID=2721623 RepID=A0ABX1GL43_9FLAO|nr:hypothetical protein [Croceivirga thetidis]NKI30586.1 hypothetical protein [Croceivirga thetidis]